MSIGGVDGVDAQGGIGELADQQGIGLQENGVCAGVTGEAVEQEGILQEAPALVFEGFEVDGGCFSVFTDMKADHERVDAFGGLHPAAWEEGGVDMHGIQRSHRFYRSFDENGIFIGDGYTVFMRIAATVVAGNCEEEDRWQEGAGHTHCCLKDCIKDNAKHAVRHRSGE